MKSLKRKYMVYIFTNVFFFGIYIYLSMKKLLIIIVIFLFKINTYALDTSAKSAILMDMDSKRVLYGKNINEQRSVASISKIMTAILAIESGKMDDVVKVGDEIDKSYGSGIYIKKGEEISLRDLVYGLMLRSGNDASYAIANYVDKNNFVDLMNKKAKEIGMLNTVFTNPNGLDEESGNYSTSYDMAILASYAMKNEEYKKIVGTKKHIVKTNKKTYEWLNKNKLLFSVDYITGGKTGFTTKAKRTLVTTAKKNNINLVAVTLDDYDDFKDHVNMFEYGYNNYFKKDILKTGKIDLYNDKYYRKYSLMIKSSFSYLLNSNDNLILRYDLADKPSLGNTGKVSVILNNKEIYSEDIIAIKKEKKRGFFERLKVW